MADVFDRLVGQAGAVAAMRHYARNPVHAYLIAGPVGSGLHETALSFAASLQCPDRGCGRCAVCRLVLGEGDSDVTILARSGLTWRVEELREAERVSRRRPLGTGYQIVVIEDIELTTTGASPSSPALLKSLEEPASRTIFILTAEDLPAALGTVVSRCVEVRLRALSEAELETVLVAEGANADEARVAATAANGNLQRARVLVRDTDLVARIARWRAVPDTLDGTPSSAAAVAGAIADALDRAVEPLADVQEREMARRVSDARQMGQRSIVNRRDVEAQFKREQRRFRIDDLRFGLTALTNVYRDRMVAALEGADGATGRGDARAGASMRAIDAIAETNRRLSLNVDETLLLNDLMLTLTSF